MKKLFLLIAMSSLAICLSGCGEQTPTQAFNEWRSAIIAGKVDAANKLTADDTETNALMVEAVKDNAFEGKILKNGSFDSEKIEGNRAIIKMKGTDGKIADFVMIKVDGKWKISHNAQGGNKKK